MYSKLKRGFRMSTGLGLGLSPGGGSGWGQTLETFFADVGSVTEPAGVLDIAAEMEDPGFIANWEIGLDPAFGLDNTLNTSDSNFGGQQTIHMEGLISVNVQAGDANVEVPYTVFIVGSFDAGSGIFVTSDASTEDGVYKYLTGGNYQWTAFDYDVGAAEAASDAGVPHILAATKSLAGVVTLRVDGVSIGTAAETDTTAFAVDSLDIEAQASDCTLALFSVLDSDNLSQIQALEAKYALRFGL